MTAVDTVDDTASRSPTVLRLFETHHLRLYQLARRLTGSPTDAEDVVQDTFLGLARGRRPVPSEASEAEAWLVRILINVCRDRWRVQSGRRRLEALHGPADWTPAAINPEAALIAQTAIWKALQVLDPRRRAVVVLHELEGLDAARIARLLGVSQVTVRWHLARGRRELTHALARQEAGTR
jgi:RNA polymerase sigma-70 factor (ECF subfamily)